MKKRVYGAFTLIEMLVVMGILIILMVVGIAAGSFALNRANDIAHRNGADQLYEGLQAYYIDNRAYPKIDSCGENVICTPKLLMEEEDKLGKYMDIGAFNGGSGATYTYFVGGDNSDQAVLICVSMRGLYQTNQDLEDGAYYCAGNGFDEDVSDGTNTININTPLIERGDPLWSLFDGVAFASSSDWDNGAWQ